MENRNRVCPAELAGSLDNKVRKWLQDPVKILSPYIKAGMTVLDIGCGPGFFTIPIAGLVGNNGKVIAADLQEAMLLKLKLKIEGTELEERVKLHKCEKDKIGLNGKADFILAFYMVHEVPDKDNFFKELKTLLNSGGSLLIIEPKFFHVSKKDFAGTIVKAESAGFKTFEGPKLLLSWSVILKRNIHS